MFKTFIENVLIKSEIKEDFSNVSSPVFMDGETQW